MTASPKVDVDANFESRIVDLQIGTNKQAESVIGSQQRTWLLPEVLVQPDEDTTESTDLRKWDGNLFSLQDMGNSFERSDLSDRFRESVSDQESPGTSGDLVAATTQIDYLGLMERAFRARHSMRRPRAMAHAAGRLQGHGHSNGVLATSALEYVRTLVKQSGVE